MEQKEVIDFDLVELGKILRKKRKEQGLRLEDVADENISPSTISSIERGLPHVNEEKIKYLCSKFDVGLHQFPKFFKEEEKKYKTIKSNLLSIENTIKLVSPTEGLKRLRSLKLESTDLFHHMIHYLKGKCYFEKERWATAQTHFFDAISMVNRSSRLQPSNIISASYYELARIAYFQNKIEQALGFAEDGLTSFVSDGEREHIFYKLLISKAIYLEKLDHIGESFKTLNELWKQVDHIKNIDVILNLYETYAYILKKMKRYDEAVDYAIQGINLAIDNKNHDRAFDLWSMLGSIYTNKKDLDEAENCFLTALSLKEKIKKEYLFIFAYTQLGLLYIEKGKWEQAKEALKEATSLGEKTNKARPYCQALHTFGYLYQRQDMYEEAAKYYEQAANLADHHSLKNQEYKILKHLIQCYKEFNPEKCTDCMERRFKIELQLEQEVEGSEQIW